VQRQSARAGGGVHVVVHLVAPSSFQFHTESNLLFVDFPRDLR
jgi:hypothetical protein